MRLHTVSFTNGDLASFARPRYVWGRVSENGKIHMFDQVVIRWRQGVISLPFMGAITMCGRQEPLSLVMAAEQPTPRTGCRKCRYQWNRKMGLC